MEKKRMHHMINMPISRAFWIGGYGGKCHIDRDIEPIPNHKDEDVLCSLCFSRFCPDKNHVCPYCGSTRMWGLADTPRGKRIAAASKQSFDECGGDYFTGKRTRVPGRKLDAK